jgi:tetratricopeptide (TPR) repeat protein
MWHHVVCWTVLLLLVRRSAAQRCCPRLMTRWLLCSAGCVLLSAAVLTSVWLVLLAVAISWLALLDCTPDRFLAGRRLTTAGFAGFFVIGFPERMQAWWSGAVTDWLTVCTSAAATLCGLVHVREGGGLRLQAGAFEMTRGVHDWGTWDTGLLPGLFWGLLQRRSGVQMLLLLPAAAAAGLLSSLPGSLLQMAWPGAHGGAIPVLQLLGVLLAIPLVLSCDAMVLFLTGPVCLKGFVNGMAGEDDFSENPVSVMWNSWVSAESGSFEEPAVFRLSDGGRVPLLTCVRFAVSGWLSSRVPSRFLYGLPGVFVLLIGGSASLGSSAATARQVGIYDDYARAALAAGDESMARFCWEAVISLEPRNLAVQYRFADLLWSGGRRLDGWRLMERLSLDGVAGYGPSHIWLLQHSALGETGFAIDPNRRVEHFRQAIRSLPAGSPDAAEAMANLGLEYAAQGEQRLSTEALAAAAGVDQRYLCELCAVERMGGRVLEGDSRLLKYRSELGAVLAQHPGNCDAVFESARASILLGERSAAIAVLQAGLQVSSDDRLSRLLSETLTADVESRLTAGNADAEWLVRNLQEAEFNDSGRPAVVLLLCDLELLGVETGLLQWVDWEGLLSRTADTRDTPRAVRESYLLAGILLERPELVELAAESLVLTVPSGVARGVALLHRRQQSEQAGRLADMALAHCADGDRLTRFALLRADQRYAEARAVYDGFEVEYATSEALRGAWYGTMVEEFDVSAAAASGAICEYPLRLLRAAGDVPETRLLAVDRLTRLVLSGGGCSAWAEGELQRLRAAGTDSGLCLEAMGHVAVMTGNYQHAVVWLEQALMLQAEPGDVLWNNLAVALIRNDSQRNGGRALRLIDHAIERSPDRPELLNTRGEIYLALRKWKLAIRDLERAAAELPAESGSQHLLQVCREHLERGSTR